MPRRRNYRRLVLIAIERHGPLSDAQLAWVLQRFRVAAATAQRWRKRLTDEGRVRFARKFVRGATGRWGQMWELAPKE